MLKILIIGTYFLSLTIAIILAFYIIKTLTYTQIFNKLLAKL